MINEIRHTITLLLLLICCAACSDKDLTIGDENISGKDPIVLSASNTSGTGEASTTRASIIDGQAKETAFEKHTRLTLLMVSEDAPASPTEKKYTVTYGLAKGSGKNAATWTDADGFSAISFATTKTSGTETQVYTDPTGTVLETAATNKDGDGSIRYWNDAHERKSVLSIYGFAINNTILPAGAPWNQEVNGKVNNSGFNFTTFTSELDYTIKSDLTTDSRKWRIGNHNKDASGYSVQNFLSLLYKDDLLYSNNLSDRTSAGGTDGRLKYSNNTTGKFDSGVLRFKRAMTMLSFKIKPGAGFSTSDPNNFKFKEGTNIALRGFYKKGNLNIKTGNWEGVVVENNVTVGSKTYNWRTIANVTNGKTINQIDDHAYYLLALVIPGTDLKTSGETDAVTIIIDGNEYTISMQELYNAIHKVSENVNAGNVKESVLEGGTMLKAGNNYEFTITIGKTSVSGIEARLIPWETAIATATASNSHVTLSLTDDKGTAVTGGGFSLYRAPGAEYAGADYNTYADYTWEKGYEGPAVNVTETSTIYDTEWYWPDNKTFYHFRTLVPTGQTLQDNDGTTTYVEMTGGSIAGGSPTATDYQWGAPFKSGSSFAYSHTTGYCNNADKASGQIYKAIGATDNAIAITQHHMTSQVFVDLETTASPNTDMVDLTGAKVELTNLATTANLQLGNGLVTGHGGYSNEQITADAHAASGSIPAYDYSYGILPQKLTGNDNTTGPIGNASGTVGIKITLADGNEYIIEDLSTIQGTPSGESKQTVTSLDPGKKYYYKFKLTKTGIAPLTATILDWETVTAGNDDVQIK